MSGPQTEPALETNALVEKLYAQIRRLAERQMYAEKVDHTLSATALVHEAYLRLNRAGGPKWCGERQFLAIVADEMRRVLVDSARRKRTKKRGNAWSRKSIDQVVDSQRSALSAEAILDIAEAIEAFAQIEPRKAELVRLRYLLGLTEAEAARILGISRATAARHWAYSRAWLLDHLSGSRQNSLN